MSVKRRNAIVGQSGGPTSAINSTLAGVISGAIKAEHIDTIYGAYNGVQGMLEDRVCNLTELFADEEKIAILRQTPASALGSCRLKLHDPLSEKGEEQCKKLFEFFEKYDIGYFFYIGGNDSMDTVSKLSKYAETNNIDDVHFIGVPKTIDNDLTMTDHTPGYGSAAKYIATSIHEILRDIEVYTVKAVTVVEIMGRDAGWLTAAAALPYKVSGVGPDLVYLPEVIFDLDEFFKELEAALERHPAVLVAVSEGIRFADGRYVGEGTQSGVLDAFGHKYLQGTARTLEGLIKERLGCKTRSVELSLPQRCAAHIASYSDIEESFRAGEYAAIAAKDETGVMISFNRNEPYSITYSTVRVSEVANKIKLVPRELINEKGTGVTDKCLDLLLPLIEGEWPVVYEKGLPVHIKIDRE